MDVTFIQPVFIPPVKTSTASVVRMEPISLLRTHPLHYQPVDFTREELVMEMFAMASNYQSSFDSACATTSLTDISHIINYIGGKVQVI